MACLECGWDDADYAALAQKLPCESASRSEKTAAGEDGSQEEATAWT